MTTKTVEPVKLADAFDVHYRNENTDGKWYRWMNAPRTDIGECHKWIREYNQCQNVAGIVHLPMQKGLRTEFRIVRMVRTIETELTRAD